VGKKKNTFLAAERYNRERRATEPSLQSVIRGRQTVSKEEHRLVSGRGSTEGKSKIINQVCLIALDHIASEIRRRLNMPGRHPKKELLVAVRKEGPSNYITTRVNTRREGKKPISTEQTLLSKRSLREKKARKDKRVRKITTVASKKNRNSVKMHGLINAGERKTTILTKTPQREKEGRSRSSGCATQGCHVMTHRPKTSTSPRRKRTPRLQRSPAGKTKKQDASSLSKKKGKTVELSRKKKTPSEFVPQEGKDGSSSWFKKPKKSSLSPKGDHRCNTGIYMTERKAVSCALEGDTRKGN